MGKISNYIIELGETYEDLLNQTGNVEAAQYEMKKLLSDDEFEFFKNHLDIIEYNLDFTDGIEGPESLEEARGLKGDVLRPWGGRKRRSKMGYGKGNRANFDPEEEIFRQEGLSQITDEDMYDDEYYDYEGEQNKRNFDHARLRDAQDAERRANENLNVDEAYVMPPINNFK